MDFKNVDEILKSFAQYVVDASKENLTKDKKGDGDLYNSLDYTFDKSQDQFLLDFLMEDYGVYVDKGVRGKTSTYPETNAALSQFQYGSGTGQKGGLTKGINAWLKKKRFQFRDKKGRFMSYDSTAFLISRSIYNKGTKPSLFFTKPFEKAFKNLPKEIVTAYALDVEKLLGNTIKDNLK